MQYVSSLVLLYYYHTVLRCHSNIVILYDSFFEEYLTSHVMIVNATDILSLFDNIILTKPGSNTMLRYYGNTVLRYYGVIVI